MKKQLFLYALGLIVVVIMTAPVGFASHSPVKKSVEKTSRPDSAKHEVRLLRR